MSITTFVRPTRSSRFSTSRATSSDALTVSEKLREVKAAVRSSDFLGGVTRKAVGELTNMFLDCFRPNWDGYDSSPVTAQTFANARAFLEEFGGDWPKPSIGTDPDGELSLEWYRAPKLRFSVSIGPDPTLAYAGMFGSSTVHGTDTFVDEVPEGIVQNLRRLYRMPV